MTTPDELLQAYDDQLRAVAEMAGCVSYDTDGPLWRGILHRGTGFVSYRDLAGLTGDELDDLIARTVTHYRDTTDVPELEWKTRGHDAPTDLDAHLRRHGFEPEPRETVMVGEVDGLVADIDLPDGVVVRRAGDGSDLHHDLERVEALHTKVFGQGDSVDRLLAMLQEPGAEVWLADVDGEVVCAGRINPVPDTDFVGIWGGGTLPAWRGRGIYRALTSARARSAREHGIRFIHSDSTDMSRPILERSGLVAVTTTTPYVWHR